MKKGTMDWRLYENYNKLSRKFSDKPFEILREEVLRIEEKIRKIIGKEPERIHIPDSAYPMEKLEILLYQRKNLLNWMFQETFHEMERMKVLNDRLFDLTQKLRIKMADVCVDLKEHHRDDFDDDLEVEGTLRFSFNGIESVRPYEGEEAYGCNFPLMIVANDWLTGKRFNHYLELKCRYNDSRESILNCQNCDDGQSWAHETAGCFDGICICHTTARFCRDFGYPLVDVLHLNDFWSEVHVIYQHFATQDPNYKYPRD